MNVEHTVYIFLYYRIIIWVYDDDAGINVGIVLCCVVGANVVGVVGVVVVVCCVIAGVVVCIRDSICG